MRSNGFVLAVALVACAWAQAPAQARCSDDLAALQARVDREQKMTPKPAGVDAAAKALNKFNQSGSRDEVECYNTVARARHALTAAPADAPAPLGQPQQPLGVPPGPPDQVLRPR